MLRGLLICLMVLLGSTAGAQLEWSALSSMPDKGRYAAIAFSINGKIYCGLGTNGFGTYFKDFWEYNPSTDVWVQKASYPDDASYAPASFSIGGKGYACMGISNGGQISSKCYSYNPITDSWSSIASFPGSVRYASETFVIGSVGYIACGNGGGPSSYKNDLWSYNTTTNSWTQRADFPGGYLDNVTAFSIGSYGYVGGGNYGSYSVNPDFWRYDPVSNNWSSISRMPEGRTVATDFVFQNKAYVGLGYSSGTTIGQSILPGFYSYNPSSNEWSQLLTNSENITLRSGTEAVEIGDSIYLMIGRYYYGVHTSLHQLKTTSDTNTVKDTVYTYIDTCYNNVDDTLTIYASGEGSGCENVLMQIYPNPSATYLYFYANKPECFSGSSLELVDQLGQVLQTHPYSSGVIQLDIRGYARALYYVRLRSDSGTTLFSKKIVIH